MTRGEVGKKLNAMLELVDGLSTRFAGRGKVQQRLDTIRDQLLLLALDLGLPVQPQKEPDAEGDRRPGEAG